MLKNSYTKHQDMLTVRWLWP